MDIVLKYECLENIFEWFNLVKGFSCEEPTCFSFLLYFFDNIKVLILSILNAYFIPEDWCELSLVMFQIQFLFPHLKGNLKFAPVFM